MHDARVGGDAPRLATRACMSAGVFSVQRQTARGHEPIMTIGCRKGKSGSGGTHKAHSKFGCRLQKCGVHLCALGINIEIFSSAARRGICSGTSSAMSEHDTFGPRLRSERERRGISLGTVVTVTKVGADLWTGLEKNDF